MVVKAGSEGGLLARPRHGVAREQVGRRKAYRGNTQRGPARLLMGPDSREALEV